MEPTDAILCLACLPMLIIGLALMWTGLFKTVGYKTDKPKKDESKAD